jgi:prepilin-type N-terminal cleavage/methylation domain-containing protein
VSKLNRGYSLLEVLTVISILGIILLVAVPAFANHRRRLAVTAAADSLRSIFREVRSRAVDRSRNSGVKFTETPSGWTYTFYDDGNGDGVTNDDIKSGTDPYVAGPFPLDFQLKPVTLSVGTTTIKDPDGDKLTPGDRPLQFGRSTICSFAPLGSGTPGSIYITDSASQLYAIRVLGATGRVRIMRYDSLRAKWVQL